MNEKLAIHGGDPTRKKMLQYGKQTINQEDKAAVLAVLEENTFLTTGPRVTEFEDKCKEYCGADYALAVNSGTAALHCAVAALQLENSDEVIVSGISFVASANCVVYCGGKPVFCDVEGDTLNIDALKIERLITNRTKAIIAVDFAGQLCDYAAIREVADKHRLKIIQDAAHSWGAKMGDKRVGNISDITAVSFHPVKNMTTCEGGMVFTNDRALYEKMKAFRQHGIVSDYKDREKAKQYSYEMTSLGFNYRIPDLLCALGTSQLKRLPEWIERRNEIANSYKSQIEKLNRDIGKDVVSPLTQKFPSAYHIYVIKLSSVFLPEKRDEVFSALKAEGVGVNVHYLPIHLHPFYTENLGTKRGDLPVAERAYNAILTLPIFPTIEGNDVTDVINALSKVINHYINREENT
jgi:perosamine synthetase